MLTLILGALAGCSTPETPPATPVSGPQLEILYQSRGEGEIEPCG